MISMAEIDSIIRQILSSNETSKEERLLCMAIIELMNDVKTIKKQMQMIKWLLSTLIFLLIVNIVLIRGGV